ncbi:hypothetical protein [Streptomyces sp. NPDC087300]|uniref:hypothetical protein n=1 Tax=Streptomyces sp. NPDC087300 TaxID=3365780 RepID=UPI0038058196
MSPEAQAALALYWIMGHAWAAYRGLTPSVALERLRNGYLQNFDTEPSRIVRASTVVYLMTLAPFLWLPNAIQCAMDGKLFDR